MQIKSINFTSSNKIEFLYLSNNYLKEINIDNLKKLKILDVSKNEIDYGKLSFSKNKNLKKLSISYFDGLINMAFPPFETRLDTKKAFSFNNYYSSFHILTDYYDCNKTLNLIKNGIHYNLAFENTLFFKYA